MRTTGTFQDVYAAAREYHSDTAEGCPMDPVVRRDAGRWMLESRLEPAGDADFECPLESFHDFFHECYADGKYIASGRDAMELVKTFTN